MMTEKETWLYMADHKNWRHVPCGFLASQGISYFFTDGSSGLCFILNTIESGKEISLNTYRTMKQKIDKLKKPRRFEGFCWPINTREGNRQRRRFCREQAAKCE